MRVKRKARGTEWPWHTDDMPRLRAPRNRPRLQGTPQRQLLRVFPRTI